MTNIKSLSITGMLVSVIVDSIIRLLYKLINS